MGVAEECSSSSKGRESCARREWCVLMMQFLRHAAWQSFLRPQTYRNPKNHLKFFWIPHHTFYSPPSLSNLTCYTHQSPFTHCQRHTYLTASSESSVCWKCHRHFDSVSREKPRRVRFFCPCELSIVLPPSTTCTYFDVMDCPVSYRVDIEALKQTFKQLQRQLHPDKFSNTSQVTNGGMFVLTLVSDSMVVQEEQDYSSQHSTLINTAFNTLLKPYTRGLYMLELNGLTIDEKDTLMDSPEFLEKMWAIRESMDEASSSGDTTTLTELQTTNTANLEKISNEVEACFNADDFVGAKECLSRMKYFVNIEELLRETLDTPY